MIDSLYTSRHKTDRAKRHGS